LSLTEVLHSCRPSCSPSRRRWRYH